jgi:hypothetical protein
MPFHLSPENRRRASRCRHNFPHLASMSQSMQSDMSLENRRLSSRRWLELSIYEPRNTFRHVTTRTTPSITTSLCAVTSAGSLGKRLHISQKRRWASRRRQYTEFRVGEPRGAIIIEMEKEVKHRDHNGRDSSIIHRILGRFALLCQSTQYYKTDGERRKKYRGDSKSEFKINTEAS